MKLRPAGRAWLGLVIYVIAADSYLIIQERRGNVRYYTMSSGFRDALKHPIKRWWMILIWIFLTFHLFDFFFPEPIRKFEPIGVSGRLGAKIVARLTSIPQHPVVELFDAQ